MRECKLYSFASLFRAEEKLIRWQHRSNNSWSFVILRLPDVLGPRDSTDRWWFYQMWIQFYSSLNRPLEIGTHLISSYVYVNDVARYITTILTESILNGSTHFQNQILNIACQENVSISDLLTMIIDEFDLHSANIPIVYNPSTEVDFFPSVTRAGIDITKASSERFAWRPTPLRQVIKETVQWYNDAYSKYRNERADIVKRLRRTLLNDDQLACNKLLLDLDRHITAPAIDCQHEDQDDL
jgi:nucleoside-diphosphate-sugar epimerase